MNLSTPDPRRLYRNELSTDPCGKPLYPVRDVYKGLPQVWQIFCTKVHDFIAVEPFVFGYVIRLILLYSKTFVASRENSKWRPISRWTPKLFYRLKFVFLIIFLKSLKIV
jgi:hypothetical protein